MTGAASLGPNTPILPSNTVSPVVLLNSIASGLSGESLYTARLTGVFSSPMDTRFLSTDEHRDNICLSAALNSIQSGLNLINVCSSSKCLRSETIFMLPSRTCKLPNTSNVGSYNSSVTPSGSSPICTGPLAVKPRVNNELQST